MRVHVARFYAGPLCGAKREYQTSWPPGWAVSSLAGDPHYYVHDGHGRYVYTQTLEGRCILAEYVKRGRG